MVVLKVDIVRVFPRPAERDAIVSSDVHGPSPQVAAQTVEPIPCDVHVLRLRCHLQRLKDTHAFPDIFGTDPASLAGEVDLFKPLISEAGDHFSTVNRNAYSVNYSIDTFFGLSSAFPWIRFNRACRLRQCVCELRTPNADHARTAYAVLTLTSSRTRFFPGARLSRKFEVHPAWVPDQDTTGHLAQRALVIQAVMVVRTDRVLAHKS